MRPKPTITVIGAASTTFGPKVLRDILNHPQVGGAAVRGDRNLVLQAMLLDPVIDSVRVAERVLKAMMAAQKDYLPQFKEG